jgi:hypothetical protein
MPTCGAGSRRYLAQQVAVGSTVPWRDAGGNGFRFSAEGRPRVNGDEDPQAKSRSVSPGFFAALGVPLLAGRDFTDADRDGSERVVIVSRTLADRTFPGQDPLNRHLMWTDGIMKFIGVSTDPRRIVGVVADIDEKIEPRPITTVYHPFAQELGAAACVRRAATSRWCRPLPASSGRSRSISRSSARPRSTTYGRKCWRRPA